MQRLPSTLACDVRSANDFIFGEAPSTNNGDTRSVAVSVPTAFLRSFKPSINHAVADARRRSNADFVGSRVVDSGVASS